MNLRTPEPQIDPAASELRRLRTQVAVAYAEADRWRAQADYFDYDAEHGDSADYTDAEREQLRESARTYRDLAHALSRALGNKA